MCGLGLYVCDSCGWREKVGKGQVGYSRRLKEQPLVHTKVLSLMRKLMHENINLIVFQVSFFIYVYFSSYIISKVDKLE